MGVWNCRRGEGCAGRRRGGVGCEIETIWRGQHRTEQRPGRVLTCNILNDIPVNAGRRHRAGYEEVVVVMVEERLNYRRWR